MASDLDDANMDDADMPELTVEDNVKIDNSKNSENSENKSKEEVLERLLKATIASDNEKQKTKLKKQAKKPEGKGFKSERDNDYFEGYGDLSIHVEMLSDFVRTDTYR